MKGSILSGKQLGALASASALLGIAACTAGFHSSASASQVYVLRAAGPPRVQHASAPGASVHVSRPIAGPGLASDRIMLVQSDHRMSYYAASRWPADLPQVLESLAVQTLRASGDWRAVEDSAGAFPSDYLLQIVIRRFEADYTTHPDSPEVHVVLDCTLGKRASRELISTFVAEGSASATANRLAAVVSAFEAAANQALGSMATQIAQNAAAPVPSSNR